MPPEPPHSQLKSNDAGNEDTDHNEDSPALDGYQPLSTHRGDDQDVFSSSSESSSDDSDEDDSGSGQRHRVCMTIQWPEEDSTQEGLEEGSSSTNECDPSPSSTPVEAGSAPTPSVPASPAADLRKLTASSQREPDSVPKGRPANLSDCRDNRGDRSADADRKDCASDRKDSSSARKDDCSSDRKDCSAGQENSSSPAAATGAMSADQTEAVRRAMQAVRLPEGAVPDWARGLTDQQCQRRIGQMVARLQTGHR